MNTAAPTDPRPRLVTGGEDGPTEVEAIEHALSSLVRRANLPRLYTKLASQAGNLVPDRSAYAVLSRLGDDGDLRLSDLSERLGIDASTASRQITQLETAKLVRRQVDPTDKRASFLALTKRGQRALARLRAARRQLVTRLVEEWSDADRAALARLLGRLADEFTRVTNQ